MNLPTRPWKNNDPYVLMRMYMKRFRDFIVSFLPFKTFGAQALVVKGEMVLLIKHTYVPGWYTIGGGVEKGESCLQAIIRELEEEVDIKALKDPELFGIYYKAYGRLDHHVAFYICKDFQEGPGFSKTEVLQKKWFPLSDLPKDLAPSNKTRIEEYLGKRPMSDRW